MPGVKDGDTFTLLVGGTRKFHVECVISPEAVKKGLSGRKKLQEGTGMLFIFPELKEHSMWMPNMKFPLDVIWLDEQFSIVHISYGLRPCEPDQTCPSISSIYSTLYAIEVNAGQAAEYGFRLGQDVKVIL
jgi:uncharacterized membrane protein (UPF0127 family)